ncbi:hypothetical protein COCC4DRAFT_33698 [Bipolaris maydis ATCC 48331]|uniref:Uncharacterized protein n=2 Tax=Cochliobolus heterostrophus TaxID=5016 RepID=M2THL2_COCH5|nr:uncharacterized protein COCC4DRAFT_33698 [Bipolaris maydis ATCC 48331]EMD85994.1 hypothetical protein COCHEDRAFT_1024224 [Bipolaris maydis C5]ENI01998.1 hypothetical protein COCC4DRAFT_33698 [Bipolaris maydis ATCC 48331]
MTDEASCTLCSMILTCCWEQRERYGSGARFAHVTREQANSRSFESRRSDMQGLFACRLNYRAGMWILQRTVALAMRWRKYQDYAKTRVSTKKIRYFVWDSTKDWQGTCLVIWLKGVAKFGFEDDSVVSTWRYR